MRLVCTAAAAKSVKISGESVCVIQICATPAFSAATMACTAVTAFAPSTASPTRSLADRDEEVWDVPVCACESSGIYFSPLTEFATTTLMLKVPTLRHFRSILSHWKTKTRTACQSRYVQTNEYSWYNQIERLCSLRLFHHYEQSRSRSCPKLLLFPPLAVRLGVR